MKIYETSSGLGYKQYAYLIRIKKSENGHDYLCIGTKSSRGWDNYVIGEIVEDLEDYSVKESGYKLHDSPLAGDYLFNYWVSNFNII